MADTMCSPRCRDIETKLDSISAAFWEKLAVRKKQALELGARGYLLRHPHSQRRYEALKVKGARKWWQKRQQFLSGCKSTHPTSEAAGLHHSRVATHPDPCYQPRGLQRAKMLNHSGFRCH
ncbi:Hypothetical predicted protein [Pelobates cultripes]|uniref:Uncharacterized protein n=1 Tax=Pelobates cultripes TaxID=61616 RepID=A0AAD1S6C1_PELCU|nr:Hypothetical predicted protein [Pelobates cultripes]